MPKPGFPIKGSCGPAWLAVAAACAACSPDHPPDASFFQPATPHEQYEFMIRQVGLERTALGHQWINAAHRALMGALTIQTPYREVGYLDPMAAPAMGYRVTMRRGQLVIVEVELGGDEDGPSRVFIDLYRVLGDTLRPFRHLLSADSTELGLEYVARWDSDYLIRVQPELLRGGTYTIRIVNAASLAFPVAGRDMRAIRSAWGAPRDGGRRRHEGVDIFAPRGTPVLAAADGVVRSVRNGGLGGRTVWVRDNLGRSHYYAHLDRQAVRRRDVVRQGDTIGFVGNTGNARTTPPHLHFGVYRGGATDPHPFLYDPPKTPPRMRVDTARVGGWVRTVAADIRVRESASSRARTVELAARHTAMRVIGGAGSWYRVVLPDGRAGFVVASSTEPADSPLRSTQLTSGATVLDRPENEGFVVESLDPGVELSVLGTFGEFLYVQTPRGRPGWVALDG